MLDKALWYLLTCSYTPAFTQSQSFRHIQEGASRRKVLRADLISYNYISINMYSNLQRNKGKRYPSRSMSLRRAAGMGNFLLFFTPCQLESKLEETKNKR